MRLELRFEYDEFAEACSHLWAEEPETPVVQVSGKKPKRNGAYERISSWHEGQARILFILMSGRI